MGYQNEEFTRILIGYITLTSATTNRKSVRCTYVNNKKARKKNNMGLSPLPSLSLIVIQLIFILVSDIMFKPYGQIQV